MSNVRKGHLTVSGEWAKHLRWYGKRLFWRRHRRTEKLDTRTEVRRREIEGYFSGQVKP